MFLYKISFPEHLTTKCYIGITKQTLKQRFKSHCGNSSKSLISKAIRKYGIENTSISIIAEHDNWDSLCTAEIESINRLNTKSPHGYNLTDGGDGLLGHVFSESHKSGISKGLKGRVFSDETLKRMSDSAKKKTFTPEHIAKLNNSIKKGSNHPNFGKKLSDQAKSKISKSLTGLKASIETRLKQSIAHSNISDELRLKFSKANRAHPPKSVCGFKGVSKTKEGNRWRARCVIMGKEKIIGNFDTPEEASEAYQKFVATL